MSTAMDDRLWTKRFGIFMATFLLAAVLLAGMVRSAFAFPPLFKTGEKVITTEGYRKLIEDRNTEPDQSVKLVRYGTVLSEDSRGVVTIYDPVTKRNVGIHRGFLRLRIYQGELKQSHRAEGDAK